MRETKTDDPLGLAVPPADSGLLPPAKKRSAPSFGFGPPADLTAAEDTECALPLERVGAKVELLDCRKASKADGTHHTTRHVVVNGHRMAVPTDSTFQIDAQVDGRTTVTLTFLVDEIVFGHEDNRRTPTG